MADWHDRAATARPALLLSHLVTCLLLLSTVLPRLSSALESVAGSPCESVCADAGSLPEDVVCIDSSYQSLRQGRAFQTCVACQLNSTAVDTAKNQTDVEWGLLALRFTLAGCMFAIPEDHISISSPCQVSCALLNESIGYQVTNNTATAQPGQQFCNVGDFDDTTINKCAFCYSFIPQQLFLANFLQALHISCREPPISGSPFFPDAASIFNETLISGPAAPSSNTSSRSGLHGWKLALAVALPIVGGILILGSACWCCFVFTRRRRQRMAQSGRMSRIHDAHADNMYYSPASATKTEAPWGRHADPPTEMHALSPTLLHPAKHQQPSPGMAQGRWSHHQAAAAAAAGDDQGTPLRSSFQRDIVGPGTGQVQDPNLHEQFFGVDDDDDDEPTVHGGDAVDEHDLQGLPGSSASPHAYYPYPDGRVGGQFPSQDHERGHFI